jgi:hypothetical protein
VRKLILVGLHDIWNIKIQLEEMKKIYETTSSFKMRATRGNDIIDAL